MISEIVDPPERLRERGPGAGREDRPELAGGDGRDASGRCGARSSSGSPTRAGPAPRELVSMWGHPDQEEGPRAFAEKREPRVAADRRDPRRRSCSTTRSPTTSRCSTRSTATMTAGEARRGRRARRGRSLGAGVRAGQAVAVQLPNGPELVDRHGRRVAGRRRVRAGQPPPTREPRCDAVAGRDRARRPSSTDGGVDRAASAPAPTTTASRSSRGRRAPPAARSRSCTPTPRYLELLDRVLGPLRGRRRDPAKRADAEPHPGVAGAQRRASTTCCSGCGPGAALVIMDRFDPATFAELVRRFEIRSTVLPPAAMAMLTDDADVDDLAPLRYVRWITAPLSPLPGPALRRQVRRRRCSTATARPRSAR